MFIGIVAYVIDACCLPAPGVKFGAFTARQRRTRSDAACSQTYLLPFEVTSVLILIAILGAIVLARKEID